MIRSLVSFTFTLALLGAAGWWMVRNADLGDRLSASPVVSRTVELLAVEPVDVPEPEVAVWAPAPKPDAGAALLSEAPASEEPVAPAESVEEEALAAPSEFPGEGVDEAVVTAGATPTESAETPADNGERLAESADLLRRMIRLYEHSRGSR